MRDDGHLLSIEEFCRRNKISRSTFYALLQAELGPKTLKIGRSVRIRRSAERRWRRQMEKGIAEDLSIRRDRNRGSEIVYW